MVARCRLGEWPCWPGRPLPAGHAAPDEGCRCGIYAATSAGQAAASVTDPPRPRERSVHRVIGRVSSGGRWSRARAAGVRARLRRFACGSHPRPPAPKRHFLRPRRTAPQSLPAAEIADALCEYGVPTPMVSTARRRDRRSDPCDTERPGHARMSVSGSAAAQGGEWPPSEWAAAPNGVGGTVSPRRG
jgi:hypothetical protein